MTTDKDARIATLAAEVEQLRKERELAAVEVERWHSAYEIAHEQATENGARLARAEASAAVKVTELSGITGELREAVAEAIRTDGSDMDDTPWEILSDERKIGWLGDADRALAVVKDYLTAHAPSAPQEAEAVAPFHFDRYVNGTLMAEGVTIERQSTLEAAMRKAARLASKGPNGETPVLIFVSPPAQAVTEAQVARDQALEEAAEAADAFADQHDVSAIRAGSDLAIAKFRAGETALRRHAVAIRALKGERP